MNLLANIIPLAIFAFVLVAQPISSISVMAKSKLIAPSDKFTAMQAINFANKAKWLDYKMARTRIRNPILRKVLLWKQLVSPNSGAGFHEIDRFMDTNPDWPLQITLQKRAEQVIPAIFKDGEVVKWFKNRTPLTPNGTARLASSYINIGKKSEAIKLVQDIWIHGNFGSKQERQFYREFRRYMTREDHIERLDRLLWEGRYYHVRRMYRRINSDYRALAEARLTLRQMQGGVDRAIARVPLKLKNDPGLVYERLRWRRKKGKNKFAQELLLNPPKNLVHPVRWWRERAILARRALRKGHISDAYTLVKTHGLGVTDRSEFVDAEWLSGWIALQFLDDSEIAYIHFLAAYQAAKFPISKSRCAYWAGRAAESHNEFDNAKHWYERASQYQTTFYGQLASGRLPSHTKLVLPKEASANSLEFKNFKNYELISVVHLLGDVELHDIVGPFIRHLSRMGGTHEWRTMLARLANSVNRPDLAIQIAKQLMREGLYLIELGYPVLNAKFRKNIEEPLIYAIVRQESEFNFKAVSPAGAIGLMQILPRTASRVARINSMPYSRRKLTNDRFYNLYLGQAYLGGLLERFKNSYILTLAAYNAGPHRVRRWIRKNGDPRDLAVDAVDWIEMIPIDETRNYVQRVIENLHVYRHLLASKKILFQPEKELSR